jgi:hypothetical protein
MDPYEVMMGLIIVFTPVICWVFTRNQKSMAVPIREFAKEFHDKRYYLHAIGYVIIIRWKAITDELNEPIKQRTGHFTDWVYSIEGNLTLHIQQFFANTTLTEILNFHYLFVYLFLIYVTTVYFAYAGDRNMTDKVTMNYLLIYALAVPYYLFFNVEVTSSWIGGMDALLYHDGTYSSFYALHDPLDNAVPSLHIAIPTGILMLNYLHVRNEGITFKEWRHYRYHIFIFLNTILFAFSILYLGIHWFVDIPLGIVIGTVGSLFIHHLQPRLRNDYGAMFKGVNIDKVRKHIVVEGILGLLLLSIIFGAVQYQDERFEELPTHRIAEGDTKFEILQKINAGEKITSTVTNFDETRSIEIALVLVELSDEAMDNGTVDWSKISELTTIHTLGPGESYQYEVEIPRLYFFIFFHAPTQSNSSDVVNIHISNDYNKDVMAQAVILSIPSVWMTAFVIYRVYRLKKEGRSWIDPTPSHAWKYQIVASDEEA